MTSQQLTLFQIRQTTGLKLKSQNFATKVGKGCVVALFTILKPRFGHHITQSIRRKHVPRLHMPGYLSWRDFQKMSKMPELNMAR